MASIGDVAIRLLASPVPVLLADTCVLLDIVRAPRLAIAQHLRAVNAIRQSAADAPPRCTLVTASIAEKEFNDNVASEVEALKNYCDELQRKAAEFHAACGWVGVAHAAPAFSTTPLPAALEALARSMMGLSTPLDSEALLRELAVQRAIDHRRPAKRGAVKDALMVEEFLELCRRLRAGGFAPPLVFLTSNPHDFCHGIRRTLHPDLEAEFTAVNLLFCMNWPQAARLLTI